MEWFKVLELYAEGGSLMLQAKQVQNKFVFRVVTSEPGLDESCNAHNIQEAHSWNSAIKLMDEYRWTHLYPDHEINKNFIKDIAKCVLERVDDISMLEKWENALNLRLTKKGKRSTSATSKFYVQTTSAYDWKELLADPDKHWKDGYSAKELAVCWQSAQDGLPKKVREVLSEIFPELEVLIGIPEHKVPLKGGNRSSQNDIWLLARGKNGLVSVAVEGKVLEDFDKSLKKWFHSDKNSKGRQERFDYLCTILGVKCSVEDNDLKYQLFHRTASAIIEAERFCAKDAVVLVHSFCKDDSLCHFEDFKRFAALFGAGDSVAIDRAVMLGNKHKVGINKDIQLHFAWVKGQ